MSQEIKVVINDVTRMSARIAELTLQVQQLNTEISNLNIEIETKNAYITELQGQITTLNTQIASLQEQVTSLTATIASQTETISSLNAQISSLNGQITALNNEISAINTAINNINGESVENPISYLATTKSLILSALQAKGSTATSATTFREYANEITALNTFPPAETTLLLHLDSDNGLNDSSQYHRPILTCGTGTPTIVTTESKFGNGSLYLDGTCGLYINQTNFFPFQMPEWTFECFFKPIDWNSSSTYAFFGTRHQYNNGSSSKNYDCSQYATYWATYNVMTFTHEDFNTPSSTSLKTDQFLCDMPSNDWHHIAITRSSTVYEYNEAYFLDGSLLTRHSSAYSYLYPYQRNISPFHNMPSQIALMCFNNISEFNRFMPCYVNEIRFSSVCRYTSNFTPTTQPFSV